MRRLNGTEPHLGFDGLRRMPQSGTRRYDCINRIGIRVLSAARILHMWVIRSRSALPITEKELKLMAAAAMMGLKRMPKAGYNTPAATGIPTTL